MSKGMAEYKRSYVIDQLKKLNVDISNTDGMTYKELKMLLSRARAMNQ